MIRVIAVLMVCSLAFGLIGCTSTPPAGTPMTPEEAKAKGVTLRDAKGNPIVDQTAAPADAPTTPGTPAPTETITDAPAAPAAAPAAPADAPAAPAAPAAPDAGAGS